MIARSLADVLVVVHLGFVVFVVLGGLVALRWRRAAWLHAPCALWGAWIAFYGGICPLTPLENALRRAGGQAGYQTSFVEHYVLPVLYPADLTRGVQIVLGTVVVIVNVTVYGLVWWRGTMRESARTDRGRSRT
jgi:hypothetical protein